MGLVGRIHIHRLAACMARLARHFNRNLARHLARHLTTVALDASLNQHHARPLALALTLPSGPSTGQARRPHRHCRCSHAESWTVFVPHHVAITVALRRGRRARDRRARCGHHRPRASCAGARSSLHHQHRPLAAAAATGPAFTTTAAATAAAAASTRRPSRWGDGTPDGWSFCERDAPLVSLALLLSLLLARALLLPLMEEVALLHTVLALLRTGCTRRRGRAYHLWTRTSGAACGAAHCIKQACSGPTAAL